MTAHRSRWLQRQLEIRLMLPVLLIVAVSGLLGFYGAQRLVERVFDRWLMDAGRSLAQQVRFVGPKASIELSPQSERLLTYDVVDRTYFEVVQSDRHLIGDIGLPQQGPRATEPPGRARAYDGNVDGNAVRVVSIPVIGASGQQALVLVAETLIKRERAQRDLLLMMLPLAALPVLAALTIGFVVRSTIRPLERIAARWTEQSHESLQPIPAGDIPIELLPFAAALNGLLERLRLMLERERQLAAIAAHQLRTPLAGLQLGLARAAEAQDVEGARSVLRDMARTTDRTARLVQQILALGRLDPELRSQLQLERIDLVAIAREVGEAYLDAAMARRIELEFVAAVPTLSVLAHPDLLIEALGNLIDNAIRYTPEGGEVMIGVATGRAGPYVEICDSGPGVPVHERAQVFDRFVRGRTATGDGSGLGLAIVNEITTLLDASVKLDQAPQGGARVTVHFRTAEAR